jgi:hypothetical protein
MEYVHIQICIQNEIKCGQSLYSATETIIINAKESWQLLGWLVRKFSHFLWTPKGGLPSTQKPVIGPYPELVKSNQFLTSYFKTHLGTVLPFMPRHPAWSFPFWFSN